MTFLKRRLGDTKVEVTAVAFGCASIGNLFVETSDAAADNLLVAAWDAGIRYFDTAPHYGRGLSEQRLGHFLRHKPRADYVVSTKVGRVLSSGPELDEADGYIRPLSNKVRYDYSGDGIVEALEGSRKRLGTEYIDIVYVHDLGAFTHGADNIVHMEAFFATGFEQLIRLKEQGKIGAFGLGVNENQVCLDVLEHGALDVILLAGRLTLLDRSAQDALIQACQNAGVSLVLGGVFNSGILATGAVDGATFDYFPASKKVLSDVRRLEQKAEVAGVNLATAALQFVKTHPSTSAVLIGTAHQVLLNRNIAALNAPITDDMRRFLASA